MVNGVILGVEYLVLATKTKMLGKQWFLGYMRTAQPFWGSVGAPDGQEWYICKTQTGLRQIEAKKELVGSFWGWSTCYYLLSTF